MIGQGDTVWGDDDGWVEVGWGVDWEARCMVDQSLNPQQGASSCLRRDTDKDMYLSLSTLMHLMPSV